MGKFRIKIKSSWYSTEYINLRWSTNGIIWHSIKMSDYSVLDNWWYIEPLTISYKEAEYALKRFDSLDKIRAFEMKELEKVRSSNERILKANKQKEAEKKAIYKKFS